MEIVYCDDCLEQIVNNVSQNEILLLNHMNQRKMFNAQLSSDIIKLTNDVKGMSKYKMDIAIKRMEVLGFINSVKFGGLKYYLTKTGRKFINNYQRILNESTAINEDEEEIEEKEEISSPSKKRKTRKKSQ